MAESQETEGTRISVFVKGETVTVRVQSNTHPRVLKVSEHRIASNKNLLGSIKLPL